MGDEIASICLERVVKRISNHYIECEVRLSRLAVTSITPLAHYVVEDRLVRAETALKRMIEMGLTPYEPFVLKQTTNFRLIWPPLVEKSRRGVHLIDGTHRLVAARNEGIKDVSVAMAEGIEFPPLPCDPFNWEGIRLNHKQRPIHEILRPFNKALFRPATTYFNSEEFIFDLMTEVTQYCARSKKAEK